MKFYLLLISCFILQLMICSTSLALNFEVGSGSKYILKMKDAGSAQLSIYISESSFTKLGVEYYFKAGDLVPIQMWQQFIFRIGNQSPIDIEAGYIKTPELKFPETLTDKYLHVSTGVQVNDFLFTDKKELDPYKIGDEQVEVPAGMVRATHYRKKRNDQTVDFWISEKAGAIGLVKLLSQNSNTPLKNYSIELISLIKNVKATINPKEAKPLSEKGKSFLEKPLKN